MRTHTLAGVTLGLWLAVAPAGIARELTPRIGLSLSLSVLIGLLIAWVGLGLSYFTNYSPGFFATSLAIVLFTLARAWRSIARNRPRPGASGRRASR